MIHGNPPKIPVIPITNIRAANPFSPGVFHAVAIVQTWAIKNKVNPNKNSMVKYHGFNFYFILSFNFILSYFRRVFSF